MSVKTLMTDEELMQLPDDGHKYEYVDGEVKVSPAGLIHERLGLRLGRKLDEFTEKHQLGGVYGSSAGYRMKSGNVLSPDISFIRKSRLHGGKSPKGFGHFAPDLAVEILSPSDRLADLQGKIKEYFENGSEQVWILDPWEKRTFVYHLAADYEVFDEHEDITGGDLLPSFSFRLGDLLE
ncbi:MAG: Uma2 family endonuclease [bacterium]